MTRMRTDLVYDSLNDELYVQETIYDDDLYWQNQREADDYREEFWEEPQDEESIEAYWADLEANTGYQLDIDDEEAF